MPKVFIDDVQYFPAEPTDPQEPDKPSEPSFSTAAFYDNIRRTLFDGSLNQGQVDGINLLGNYLRSAKLTKGVEIEQAAYILATVYHETARTIQPIKEYGGRNARYAPWYGRGYVQLTWEENYKKQQAKLREHYAREQGVPWAVHENRELALNPDTSALITIYGMLDGDFTGKALANYINMNTVDYVGARRVVNGRDRANKIADYARKFEAAIREGFA